MLKWHDFFIKIYLNFYKISLQFFKVTIFFSSRIFRENCKNLISDEKLNIMEGMFNYKLGNKEITQIFAISFNTFDYYQCAIQIIIPITKSSCKVCLINPLVHVTSPNGAKRGDRRRKVARKCKIRGARQHNYSN